MSVAKPTSNLISSKNITKSKRPESSSIASDRGKLLTGKPAPQKTIGASEKLPKENANKLTSSRPTTKVTISAKERLKVDKITTSGDVPATASLVPHCKRTTLMKKKAPSDTNHLTSEMVSKTFNRAATTKTTPHSKTKINGTTNGKPVTVTSAKSNNAVANIDEIGLLKDNSPILDDSRTINISD